MACATTTEPPPVDGRSSASSSRATPELIRRTGLIGCGNGDLSRIRRVTEELRGTPVHHPAHYNAHPSGIECIDLAEWLPGNLFNALKYLWRKDEKGKPTEDAEKALWYVTREIGRMKVWGPMIHLNAVPGEIHLKYQMWHATETDEGLKEIVRNIWLGQLETLLAAQDMITLRLGLS